MNKIKKVINNNLPESYIKYEATKYSILEQEQPLFFAVLIIVGIECNVLLGDISCIILNILSKKLEKLRINNTAISSIEIFKYLIVFCNN